MEAPSGIQPESSASRAGIRALYQGAKELERKGLERKGLGAQGT